MGGGSDIEAKSDKLRLPVDLLAISENHRHGGEYVYRDNWTTVKVFEDLLTQWRQGFGGPTGIDYKALPVVFDIRNIKSTDREVIFNGLQVMEAAAITEMKERAKS